ncbi:MAG TPA: sugar transferase [Kofleriaceae bacterium]|nr:sugar transferase [Kofleriaceae bacterium]
MQAERNRPLRVFILILDALLVLAAMALAAGLHAALRDHVAALKDPPRFDEYALLVYLTMPLWIGLEVLFGLHKTFERVWTRTQLALDLLKLHVAGFLGLSAAVVATQATLNRSLILLFLGCSFLLSYAVRSALGLWQSYQHASGQARLRLLVIGEQSDQLAAFLRTASAERRPPFVVGQLGVAPVGELPHLGRPDELERVLHENAVDHVLLFAPHHRGDDVARIVSICETVGVRAELIVDLAEGAMSPPRVVNLYGRPFISFDSAAKKPEWIALKHAFDWIVAAIGTVLLLPVLIVTALAILITMGRPILFTQTRAGLNGRPFRMFKFRTMVVDAESRRQALADQNEMTGPVFKVTNDPRVTGLGRFLRKTSIDELPQLFNVLLGQMSLVGPRPLPIDEQKAIRGWHRKRLSMKPGITGIWQISGRNNIDFEEWMRLDHEYIDAWSLRLDLAILAKTVPAVMFRRGAR